MNAAIPRSFDVLVQNDFADASGAYKTAPGVFHGRDVPFHGGLHAAVFEGEVGIGLKGAILQDEVLTVAQGLGAADVAAFRDTGPILHSRFPGGPGIGQSCRSQSHKACQIKERKPEWP